MSTTADLPAALLDELKARVGAFAFAPKPVGQSFRRRTPTGWISLHVAFIPHATDLDVTADVAVRIDALEDLVNRLEDRLPRAERARTASLGGELGNLTEGRQRRWTLARRGDAAAPAESILATYERVATSELDRLTDLSAAFQVLASNDRDGWRWSPIHHARCERAVGLAFLIGGDEAVGAVIERSEAFLAARADPALPAFQRFVARLRDD